MGKALCILFFLLGLLMLYLTIVLEQQFLAMGVCP